MFKLIIEENLRDFYRIVFVVDKKDLLMIVVVVGILKRFLIIW